MFRRRRSSNPPNQSWLPVFHQSTSSEEHQKDTGPAAMASASASLPTFALTELKLGRLIGKGGFSFVNDLEGINVDEVYDMSDEDARIRRSFAQQVGKLDLEHRYVVKMLRDDLPEDEHTKGVVDLAIEADFLQTLSHPNIITMRAMGNSDPYESKFFVVLDFLRLTLERKMNYWRKDVGANTGVWMGPCFGYCCAKNHELYRIWLERLTAARDIAKALSYLHEHDIVYRDLKPDNVGFDAKCQVKIFDFGLAKRLDPADKVDSDLYNLTGATGSLRYMAPEVALEKPYNKSVDSYSFGILFWQICSLTTPYIGMTTRSHEEKVVKQGHRPIPDQTWPATWVQLMKDCWSTDMFARPDVEQVVQILDAEVTGIESEEGVVPSRASEIRAKKRKTKNIVKGEKRLDVDTRIHTDEDTSVKRFDANIV